MWAARSRSNAPDQTLNRYTRFNLGRPSRDLRSPQFLLQRWAPRRRSQASRGGVAAGSTRPHTSARFSTKKTSTWSGERKNVRIAILPDIGRRSFYLRPQVGSPVFRVPARDRRMLWPRPLPKMRRAVFTSDELPNHPVALHLSYSASEFTTGMAAQVSLHLISLWFAAWWLRGRRGLGIYAPRPEVSLIGNQRISSRQHRVLFWDSFQFEKKQLAVGGPHVIEKLDNVMNK
jgi:hypothetical protein